MGRAALAYLCALFDFTKIQVIKCRNKPAYSYDADFEFELTLKKF